jgi:hypothetical protein
MANQVPNLNANSSPGMANQFPSLNANNPPGITNQVLNFNANNSPGMANQVLQMIVDMTSQLQHQSTSVEQSVLGFDSPLGNLPTG